MIRAWIRLLAALLRGHPGPRLVTVGRDTGEYVTRLGQEQWAREHPWAAYRY